MAIILKGNDGSQPFAAQKLPFAGTLFETFHRKGYSVVRKEKLRRRQGVSGIVIPFGSMTGSEALGVLWPGLFCAAILEVDAVHGSDPEGLGPKERRFAMDVLETIKALVGGDTNVSSVIELDGGVQIRVKDASAVRLSEICALAGVESAKLTSSVLKCTFIHGKGKHMGQYHELAGEILKGVGGIENIKNVRHCITRLRFTLKDEKIAQDETIGNLDGVIQVMKAGGQYQVVIGAAVDDVYEELVSEYKVPGVGTVAEDDAAEDEGEKSHNVFNMLMDTVSGCMAPTLMPLAAAGMIKGLLALCIAMGWLTADSGTYMIWYSIADGFFYFLPIILGYTAAKKFGCNGFLGMALGAALVYPSMVNLASAAEVAGTIFEGTAFQMSFYNTFLGIPVILPASGYTSSVIPILIAVWAASKLEGVLNKAVPQLIRSMAVPFLCFAVMAPATYLVIGPVASMISGVLTLITEALINIPVVGGALVGLVVGGAFSTLVMFGLHWAVIPIMLNNIAMLGYDPLMAAGSIGGFVGVSQGLAVILRTKSDKTRNVAIPATISQFFGVGEPLLYGIQLPSKFLFVQNIIFSGAAGLVMGALNVHAFSMGSAGLFGIPTFMDPSGADTSNIVFYLGTLAVIMVIAFIFTMATYHDDGSYLGKKRAEK